MHTLWVREHNRIAQSLLNQNFSSDAETVFQQARRLVIAKIQKITYEEYLPAIHGPDPLPGYSGYDETINPTIYNDMRSAPGLPRHTEFGQITTGVDLQIALSEAYEGDIDRVDTWVGGLSEDPIGEAQLGALFNTVILRQFQELRDGDRFWYQRDLTAAELDRLAEVTLATVIRDNTNIGNELPDDVFSVE